MSEDGVVVRLSPMPRKLEVLGTMAASPSRLAVCALDRNAWTERAANELALFIGRNAKTQIPVVREASSNGRTVICLASQRDAQRLRNKFMNPFFANPGARQGFHAYRINHLAGNPGLVLQGLSDEGVYWGMKTLKQLIRFESGRVILPKVRVLDGADLEERGVWTLPLGVTTCPFKDRDKSLRHYQERMDWMSDHKMNLMEVVVCGEGGGIGFRSRKHPEFCHPDVADREYLLKQLFRYGESRGLRMVPIFTHGEHYDFIAAKFPELACRHSIRHHGQEVKIAVNFFHPGTQRIFRDLAEEVMELLDPAELYFWPTENRLHCLPPEKRTKSEFLQEAQTYYGIVQRLRKGKPGLRVKMCLTQGTYPENLSLVRAMPRDVKWVYYSGERFGTYNIRPINPITEGIAKEARAGRWFTLCTPVRGTPARPTVFNVLRTSIRRSVESGFRGHCGWTESYPADKMGLFVEGEYAWNSAGRPLEETFRAFAASCGVRAPRKQAEAYRLFDEANFAHGIRNSVCLGQPMGTFSRFQNMLERIRDNDKVDELMMLIADAMEVDDLPVLAKSVVAIERAIAMADPLDRLFILRARYLRQVLKSSLSIAKAFYMNCREKSWDLYKGDWGDFHDELSVLLRSIRKDVAESAPSYRQLVKLEKWGKLSGSSPNPLDSLSDLAKSIVVKKVTTSRD